MTSGAIRVTTHVFYKSPDTRGEERETRRCARTEWNGRRVEDGGNGSSDREKMDDDYWRFLCLFTSQMSWHVFVTWHVRAQWLKMATGKMPADTSVVCPRPRRKFRARARARHPPRVSSCAHARYPRACLARGHARVPARSRRRPPGPLPRAGSGSLAPCACV